MPARVLGAARLGADIILRQDAARGEQQRIARAGTLVGRHVFRHHEFALAVAEFVDVHNRRAERVLLVHRPLHRAHLVERLEADTREGGRELGYLIHDFAGMLVIPVQAHGIGHELSDLPVAIAVLRRHRLAHALDAALGIGEGAVLFQERRAGQEDMGITRGLVQEQVLDDHALHRG